MAGERGGRGAALIGLGACALAGAGTTLANTLLPHFYGATSFDARMGLVDNPFYVARQWVLLAHPVFTVMLALGAAFALWERAPGRAAAGYSFAFVEKLTELLLGFTILVVVNGLWKTGYLAGGAEAAGFRARIKTFEQVTEAAYPLLWAMFILSTALFCSALTWRGLEGWVALTGAATIAITAMMFLAEYLGQHWGRPLVSWSYPPALTAHRLLLGLWLIREGRRLSLPRP